MLKHSIFASAAIALALIPTASAQAQSKQTWLERAANRTLYCEYSVAKGEVWTANLKFQTTSGVNRSFNNPRSGRWETDYHSAVFDGGVRLPSGQISRWRFRMDKIGFEQIHHSGVFHVRMSGTKVERADPLPGDKYTFPVSISTTVEWNGSNYGLKGYMHYADFSADLWCE